MRVPAQACVVVALCACASKGTTVAEYDEIAQIVGASIATPEQGGLVGAFADTAMLARGGMPAGLTDASGIITGDRYGVTYRYMIWCRDAAGAMLDACGDTAATANVVADGAGTLHMAGFDATVDRRGTWNLMDVASASSALAGGDSLTLDAAFPGSTYHVTTNEDLQLVLAMGSGAVASGTVAATLAVSHTSQDMHGSASWTFTVRSRVVFDAKGATLVLDDARGYLIDLATGAVSRAPVR